VYQHHGIVMDVYWRDDDDDDSGGQWMLKIADFSNWEQEGRPTRKKSFFGSNCKSGGCIRSYDCPAIDPDRENQWYKVEYEAGWWKRHWHRSGTCTAVQSDAPGLVRARVQFLLEHADILPKYNAVQSNCECVAVWCKTGTWATLQASSWLAVTAAGQAKSAFTVAGAVAGTQVTVPAAGAWGWLGYTTHVSLVSTQPYLLPAIVTYGVITAGAPAIWLARAKNYWKELTVTLNTAFWEHAVDHPEVFVECITHWSSQYEPTTSEATELVAVPLEDDVPTTLKADSTVKESSQYEPTTSETTDLVAVPLESAENDQGDDVLIILKADSAAKDCVQTTGQRSVELPVTRTTSASVLMI
jgi:hypothetical protein